MIGFDIGGTKCAVSVGYENNHGIAIMDKKVFLTNHNQTPYENILTMCQLAEAMTDDVGKIGISCGGPLDSKAGVIMSPPNLPGWDNVQIVKFLEERYHGKVMLQNDANACAVAEWKYGAGQGTQNMVFLTCGSGMGAGLILNGQLYEGANGNAGEVGHVRIGDENGLVGFGKAGSFEGYASGKGMARIAIRKAEEAFREGESVSYCLAEKDISLITAKSIVEQAEAGYRDALDVIDIYAEKLGSGIAILIDIINPERVVIGSVYQRAENLIRPKMLEAIEREALSGAYAACEILPAKLQENIGDYAALSLASLC